MRPCGTWLGWSCCAGVDRPPCAACPGADAHNEQVRVWVAKSEVNFKTYGQLVATQRAIATRTDADVIITMLDELLEECERSGIR